MFVCRCFREFGRTERSVRRAQFELRICEIGFGAIKPELRAKSSVLGV